MASPSLAAPWRIGVDVGGTFTDMVLRDAAGALHIFKAPSVPADPSQGVLGVLRLAAERLGLAKTVVSTHMQRLESEVGANLLVRTVTDRAALDAALAETEAPLALLVHVHQPTALLACQTAAHLAFQVTPGPAVRTTSVGSPLDEQARPRPCHCVQIQ